MPCVEPVRRAPVKFPKGLLVGGPVDSTMYSGYVNVTEQDFLFYWLAEAHADAPVDAPLIVWSNGGPGCSAMEGATTEHGPLVLYRVKQNGKLFSGKLSQNPYAWNRAAHVLYVDQPRYVGFSFGSGPRLTSSVQAGEDMVTFLRGWRLLFPEHAHRELIFAAESYGGHYVPAWTHAVLEYNRGASDPLVISGLLIGNGIVNETLQQGSVPEFARRQGLIERDRAVASDWEAREAMEDHLGFVPNYYDYRLAEEDCCGCSAYNYKPWADWMLRADVAEALHVCGDAGFEAFSGCAAGCIELPTFDHNDNFSYSAMLGRALQLGIRVTLYYGMQDTACNYVGGYAMASALSWSGTEAFNEKPLEDLIVGGAAMGKMKRVGGLTWMQVEAAGHMVPNDNPAAAFYAVNTLTSHHSHLVRRSSVELLNKADADVEIRPAELSETTQLQFVAVLAVGCAGLVALAGCRAWPKHLKSTTLILREAEQISDCDWPELLPTDTPRGAELERQPLARFTLVGDARI